MKNKTFVSTDPNNHQSENTWFTPEKFKEIGDFYLDPCTVSFRPFDMAEYNVEYDKNYNGLKMVWSGDVWLNPPYGKEIMPFVQKFIQHRQGVMLVFARMGAPYIQESLKAGAMIYCLRKRVAFIDKSGKKGTNAGTDSCLVFFDTKWINKIKNVFEGVLITELEG